MKLLWISCMGTLRAPICYLDDTAHKWFPGTFFGHWTDRPEKREEPWLCRLHNRMAERYWLKRHPEYFEEDDR